MENKKADASHDCTGHSIQTLRKCATEGTCQENWRTYVDIVALIRSVQRAAGDPDCFRNGLNDCDQTTCSWRVLCLE